MIFNNNKKVVWNTIYAFFEILQAFHKGKNNTKNTEKIMSDGSTAIAKNILFCTKNNPKIYNHIGTNGLNNNLFDSRIKYLFPEDKKSKYS